ncbi:MAG: leucine efflux protein LeuE [Burkholderiaceae bacterium]|nr:leucine efflux protein LeuE [Burkholderiaceae bacterium]
MNAWVHAQFGVTDFWTFVVGTVLIVLLPGPNSLYVLSVAAQRGVRTGYRSACGVFLGDLILMLLSAGGVASLLRASPELFSVVKYVGAGYLGWIGLQMLRSAWRSWGRRGAPPFEPLPAPAAGDPFMRALVISLLNPKAILFFISFFIQFVDPRYDQPWWSFSLLGLVCELTSFAYLTVLIFVGARLAAEFRRRQRLAAGMTAGVGVLFIGFGAKLATATL